MSPLLVVLASIVVLLLLIVRKVNAVPALLIVSISAGLLLHMPVNQVMESVGKGIGSTLGNVAMVLALGAMLGRLIEESGLAQKLVDELVRLFTVRHIQWAVLLTGLLVGIPLFYNAGFVILIPLVFALAASTRLPALFLGLPMAAALSITHGFLPPHPGPIALATVFKADVGKTLLYGLTLAIPIAVLTGILFPRLALPKAVGAQKATDVARKYPNVSTSVCFLVVLLPVLLIAAGTIGSGFSQSGVWDFFKDPTIALLISLFTTIAALKIPMAKAMEMCVDGVKSVAIIVFIIGAGGAFKQILVDSQVGELLKAPLASLSLPPLALGWIIAALFRVLIGSATVAALTASGLVLPLLGPQAPPELMVLAVGAGSVFLSHVNDTGFWMFKEYFGLSLGQTFRTWTLMESLISLAGLTGVLMINTLVR